MKIFIPALLVFVFVSSIKAQDNLPDDYLTKEFHKNRREAFRNLMPDNSVAIVFSYPERNFSNDVDYIFHQNPNLYYLSGYNEPDAVLLIFKDLQGKGDTAFNEMIFVRERDKATETWTGRRLGIEGTKNKLGFSQVLQGKDFEGYPIDYKKFTKILYDNIPVDIKSNGTGYDLSGLLKTFKVNANIIDENETLHNLLIMVSDYANMQNLDYFIEYIKPIAEKDEEFSNNTYIRQILANPDSVQLSILKAKLKSSKNGKDTFTEIISSLRQIKTPEEIALMRKAIKISTLAHSEAIKAVTPATSENEIEGIHRYIHRKYGAEDEGYPPIVGSGANGCILHYEENNSTRMNNQLLLMDVGAAYHGYSADITRTVPASGKFTKEQREIYDLVYNAQAEIFKMCTQGSTFDKLEEKASEILAAGLIKLGILKNIDEIKTYYPHSCSHYLGLDVHDVGDYRKFKENMIITVEPGIYIPAGSACDPKWWNIGVRIEDDVLITKAKCEILSIDLPSQWNEIEKLANQKSMFNNSLLPKL